MADTMFDYQRGALLALNPARSGNSLPYGAGKSWVSLAKAMQVRQGSAVGIIFCRNRLQLGWRREIGKRYPHSTISSIDDGRLADFLIVPHHRIAVKQNDIMRYIQAYCPATMLFDESTKGKNPKAQLTESICRIGDFHQRMCGYSSLRIFQTGRPMPESPTEIWSQFKYAYQAYNPLGDTYYQFLNRWFLKADWSYALKLELEARFYDTVRNGLVELDEEGWLEYQTQKNTSRRYIIENYEETAEQKKMLAHLDEHWEIESEEGDETVQYQHIMSLMMKRQQIASGFYYNDNGEPVKLKSSPKLDLLKEVLEDSFYVDPDRKVVIWYAFTAEERDIKLQMMFTKGVRGFASGLEPEQLTRFLEDDDCNVGIFPLDGAEGLNELVGADVAIFYSNKPSSECREQAEARLDRLGQQSPIATYIDLCGQGLRDNELVTMLQGKSLTKERLETLVRKRDLEVR